MFQVHLTTFNHPQPPFTIVDQIRFLRSVFRHLGVRFTFGPGFRGSALNFIIENIKGGELALIDEFNATTGKRVGLILTEHVSFRNGTLFVNTTPIYGDQGMVSDYQNPDEMTRRFVHLLDAFNYTRTLYSLGDYPHMGFLSDLRIEAKSISIPFPPVTKIPGFRDIPGKDRPFDLVFTGNMTRYRREILDEIRGRFRLNTLTVSPNEWQRGRLYRNACFLLNVPQDTHWRWTSPMRLLAGLMLGRTTVSLFTQPQSEIDSFAFHASGANYMAMLEEILTMTPDRVEAAVLSRYNASMGEKARWVEMKRDLAHWAAEEGLA